MAKKNLSHTIRQELRENFAHNLRTRMHGMSRQQLSDATGLSQEDISRLRNLDRNESAIPRLDEAAIIAAALGCNINELTASSTVFPDTALEQLKNAESMRAHPVIYKFLEHEAKERLGNLFQNISPRPRLWWQLVGSIQIPIPVAVLSEKPVVLSSKAFREVARLQDLGTYPHVKRIKQRMAELEEVTEREVPTGAFEDKPVYSMLGLRVEGDRKLVDCGLTTYYSMVATHDNLEFDLLYTAFNLQKAGVLTVQGLMENTYARHAFFEQARYSKALHMGLSISALLVFNTDQGYKTMARRRASTVAAYPNLLHLIPAFVFQPEMDPDREWDLNFAVTKEYAEELFGVTFEELGDSPITSVRRSAPAREFMDAVDCGKVEVVQTGLVLNLMSMRPEICYAIICHDASWFAEQKEMWAINHEFARWGESMNQAVVEAPFVEWSLEHVESEFTTGQGSKITGLEITSRWAPVGLASFWLGVKAARERIQERSTRHFPRPSKVRIAS